MARIKIKSPPARPSIASLLSNPDRLYAVMDAVPLPTRADGRYIHYHKLSYSQPPAGLTHADWWAGLKLRRIILSRKFPLLDTAGRPHSLCKADSMDELLHRIDRTLTGVSGVPPELLNSDTRDSLMFSALIEEATLSSQMEGATTSRRIAADMLRSGRRPRDHSERMIFNNFRAMQEVQELADQSLSPELVCRIHRVVTEGTLQDPQHAGAYRAAGEGRFGVYDGEDLIHEAPPPEQLAERMAAMCQFANEEKPGGVFLHPILKAIVLHYWLAHDHPFEDGNGRTARSLFYWSMLHQGYSLCQFISISAVIAKAKKDYERAFLYVQTDENDLTYFVLQQLGVIDQSIGLMYKQVRRRAEGLERTRRKIRESESLNHRQLALLDRALVDHYAEFTVESHSTSHRVSLATARNDLNALLERGLLATRKAGKRLIYHPAPDIASKAQG